MRFLDLIGLAVIEELLKVEGVSEAQIRVAAETVLGGLPEEREGERRLLLVGKERVCIGLLCLGKCQFDPPTQVIAELNLDRIVQDVTARLNQQAGGERTER